MQKTGLDLHSICHMKYLRITLCLVVFLSGCSFTENTKIAPPFKIDLYETVDYKKNTVFDLRLQGGKPTIVNFWFPSCPPCVAEFPQIDQFYLENNNLIKEEPYTISISIDNDEKEDLLEKDINFHALSYYKSDIEIID